MTAKINLKDLELYYSKNFYERSFRKVKRHMMYEAVQNKKGQLLEALFTQKKTILFVVPVIVYATNYLDHGITKRLRRQ